MIFQKSSFSGSVISDFGFKPVLWFLALTGSFCAATAFIKKSWQIPIITKEKNWNILLSSFLYSVVISWLIIFEFSLFLKYTESMKGKNCLRIS